MLLNNNVSIEATGALPNRKKAGSKNPRYTADFVTIRSKKINLIGVVIIKLLFQNKVVCLKIAMAFLIVIISVLMAYPQVKAVYTSVTRGRLIPIYSVETDEKKIAVTINAAAKKFEIDPILDALDEYDAKSTFFICGMFIDKYPEDVKKILARGHELGNHGNTHADQTKLDAAGNKREIADLHNKVYSLTGIHMNLFRAPYGWYNNTVVNAAMEEKYFTIQWDVDSHDWMGKGTDHVINQVLNNQKLRNGSIILFHIDAVDTLETLPHILQQLDERGYSFVKVSDLIYTDNFTVDFEGRQRQN